jgi:hypothetical protein
VEQILLSKPEVQKTLKASFLPLLLLCSGLDYTVAHYGIVTKDPRLDAVLCFVAEQPDSNDVGSWEEGEVGAT